MRLLKKFHEMFYQLEALAVVEDLGRLLYNSIVEHNYICPVARVLKSCNHSFIHSNFARSSLPLSHRNLRLGTAACILREIFLSITLTISQINRRGVGFQMA